MPIRLRSIALFVVATSSLFWACAPDLDSLVAGNTGGAGGSGGTAAGKGGGPGSGGSGPATGGTGTTESGGAAGTGQPEAGQAGAAGDTSLAGMGGTGATGGTGGSGTMSEDCSNSAQDPEETDIDCGGVSDCKKCGTGLKCDHSSDCISMYCRMGRCAAPTCGDGVKNQDETGKDCGGTCAPALACDIGVGCSVDADCKSEVCKNHVCVDHCGNGRKEADETDTDCGGLDCAPCGATQHCQDGSDCSSKICNNKQCTEANCSDLVPNQDESDKDCGGVCTAEDKYCQLTQKCNTGADCESFVCVAGKCEDDIVIASTDLIDDFEDGNMVILDNDGRVGNWYPYGDGTGSMIGTTTSIPGKRGPDSSLGMHASGSGFTGWGCGVGADINNGGAGQADKHPYDASAFSAVTFWARAETATPVTVVLPDGDTDAAGMICVPPTGCDHHWLSTIQVGPMWQRFTVSFDALSLEPGGDPVPTAFDPSRLVSVQFRISPNTTFDLWIDDVAFVRQQ